MNKIIENCSHCPGLKVSQDLRYSELANEAVVKNVIRESWSLQRNKNKRKMLQNIACLFFCCCSYIEYLQARSFRAKSFFF